MGRGMKTPSPESRSIHTPLSVSARASSCTYLCIVLCEHSYLMISIVATSSMLSNDQTVRARINSLISTSVSLHPPGCMAALPNRRQHATGAHCRRAHCQNSWLSQLW